MDAEIIENKSAEMTKKLGAGKAKAKATTKTVSAEECLKRLASLAEDTDTLNKFVGSQSVGAVKALCKLIADNLQENPAMRWKNPPVQKLFRH